MADKPEPGKQYALTSFRDGGPSIAAGNTWAESEVREYRVTLKHDEGTVRIVTAASSPEAAAAAVCRAEGAPARSVVKVEPVVGHIPHAGGQIVTTCPGCQAEGR